MQPFKVYLWPFQVLSIFGILASFFILPLWGICLSFAIGYLLAVIAQPIAMHRYFTHRSFSVNKFWNLFLLLVATVSASGSTLSWIMVHRMHHRFSDTPNDPHSPKYRGIRNVFFASWFTYVSPSVEPLIEFRKDKLQRFFHDYYYHTQVVYLIFLTVVNPYLLFPLYFYPVIITLLMASVINSYNHRTGESSDSLLMSWLIAGEGWHDYHHKHPAAYYNQFPDFSGFIIKMIKKN